jgi:hypothetical protein
MDNNRPQRTFRGMTYDERQAAEALLMLQNPIPKEYKNKDRAHRVVTTGLNLWTPWERVGLADTATYHGGDA